MSLRGHHSFELLMLLVFCSPVEYKWFLTRHTVQSHKSRGLGGGGGGIPWFLEEGAHVLIWGLNSGVGEIIWALKFRDLKSAYLGSEIQGRPDCSWSHTPLSPKTHSQSENSGRAADCLGFLKKLVWLFEGLRKIAWHKHPPFQTSMSSSTGTEENLANAGSLKMGLIVLTLRHRKKRFYGKSEKIKNFEKVVYSSIFFTCMQLWL